MPHLSAPDFYEPTFPVKNSFREVWRENRARRAEGSVSLIVASVAGSCVVPTARPAPTSIRVCLVGDHLLLFADQEDPLRNAPHLKIGIFVPQSGSGDIHHRQCVDVAV
jgi:hypothetical protein